MFCNRETAHNSYPKSSVRHSKGSTRINSECLLFKTTLNKKQKAGIGFNSLELPQQETKEKENNRFLL